MARGIHRLRAPDEIDAEAAEGPADLRALLDSLPGELRAQALTHSSWVEDRASSYGRLAFLGDSVLGLVLAEHLFRRFPHADIGRLTKIHGQAVSGRACAAVAEALGVADLLARQAPHDAEGGIEVPALTASERALSSICEAVIGACYLHHGLATTEDAIIAAFAAELQMASEQLLDFKSALQERAARDGLRVKYEITGEVGPPHDRIFDVSVAVDGETVGRGSGRSKKAAEQAAAAEALDAMSA